MTATNPLRPAERRSAAGESKIDTAAILRLAAPLMMTNAIQAVLNLTDTWFVGRLSTTAVAAMSAIYWIMSCAVLVLSGVGLAVQTFVSQAVGGGRRWRASQAGWNALWASAVTLPIFILLAFSGPGLLRPFHLDREVESLALQYWEPRMYGAVLGCMGWAITGFFNGIGATRVSFAIVLAITLSNAAFNALFIFGLGQGIAGAAWGTNAAQALGLALGLWLLTQGRFAKSFKTSITWRPRWRVIRQQLKVGIPIGVMYGADVLGVALFQLMVGQVGQVPAAATQIVISLTSLAYMPTLGIASAGTTLVGQAIGAGERDWAARIGSRVILLCVLMMASVAVFLLLAGPAVIPWFAASGDAAAAETIALAMTLLWPAAAYQAIDGLYFGSSFCLRAAGDTRVPALTALALSWLLFVPLAHTWIFAPGTGWIDGLPQAGMGALGGWLSLMTYAILLGYAVLLRWRSGHWRRLSVPGY